MLRIHGFGDTYSRGINHVFSLATIHRAIDAREQRPVCAACI